MHINRQTNLLYSCRCVHMVFKYISFKLLSHQKKNRCNYEISPRQRERSCAFSDAYLDGLTEWPKEPYSDRCYHANHRTFCGLLSEVFQLQSFSWRMCIHHDFHLLIVRSSILSLDLRSSQTWMVIKIWKIVKTTVNVVFTAIFFLTVEPFEWLFLKLWTFSWIYFRVNLF